MAASSGPRSVVDTYLSDLAARCTPHHVENVRSYLARALKACPGLQLGELIRWRNVLREEGLANRTINTAVGSLLACLRWATDVGLMRKNPIPVIRRLPQRQGDMVHQRRALTESEIARYLSAARRIDERLDCAQLPLWETLLATGLRFSEAAALTTAHLSKKDVVVRASTAKTRTGRRVPISPCLHRMLRDLGREPFLLVSPRGKAWNKNNRGKALRLFHEIRELARIPRRDEEGKVIDIHALRKTACSRMLRKGVPVEVVQRVLGHTDPQMTLRAYTDLATMDLRKAMRRAWR